MMKVVLLLVVSVVSVTALCKGCKYGTCAPYVPGVGFCPSGFESTDKRDCCEKIPLVGTCVAYKVHCKPSASCKWYDFDCNSDKVTDVFDDIQSDVKDEWSKLEESTKDGFKDPTSFSKIPVSEINKVSSKLLSEAKSVSGMTVPQMKGIGKQMTGMTGPEMMAFLKRVDTGVLKDSVKEIGAVGGWVTDNAGVVVDQLEKDQTFGKVSKWSKENVEKAGNLVKGVKAKDLAKWSNTLITDPAVAGKLVGAQIGALAQKTGSLSKDQFKKLYDDYAPDELKAALPIIGSTVKWGKEKTKSLYDKLEERNFFGNFSEWSKDTFILLGEIVGPIVLEGKVSHINKDTFKEVGEQIVRGIFLSFDFKDALFEWKVEVISDILIKISECFGGDVEKWTKKIVGFVGPAIINVKKIPGKVLMESLPTLQKFNWQSVKGLTDNFAKRLQSPDTLGKVAKWNSAAVTKLGDILPVVLTPADLNSLPKETFDGAATALRDLADRSQFDRLQLKTLASKAKEAWGPTKQWTQVHLTKAGAMLSGMSKQDLLDLKDDIVVTIPHSALSAMDTLQLNAFGKKLQKISQAKNSVFGKKMIALSVEARQALLNCDKCINKFVDVAVRLKKNSNGAVTDLKALLQAATNATVEVLTVVEEFGEVVVPVRITVPIVLDPSQVVDDVNKAVRTGDVVGDLAVLGVETTQVDANAPPVLDNTGNGSALAAPVWKFCFATVVLAFTMVL